MKINLQHAGGVALVAAHLLAFPAAAQEVAPAIPSLYEKARGALDKFDCLLVLPQTEEKRERFLLGDAHGFLHVYQQREQSYEEVWVSETLESAIAGLFLADVNLDGLDEIVVYTEAGRIHFLDSISYLTLWSNPHGDFETMTAMTLHNVDDDEQVELLFVADGRLYIYDGRDQFEEWRSDQDNITATQIIVGDVDGDGAEEIVLNDGFVFDARYRDLEWQSPEPFGERMALLDIDDDTIPEVIGEFQGRFLRIFDIDLRRMKAGGQ